MQHEQAHPVFGPMGISLYSKYLLVAGYLNLSFIMPSLAQTVFIDDVKVELIQVYNLQSQSKPERTEVKSVIVPIWSMKQDVGVSGGLLSAEQAFTLSRQFRLPDDSKIRPSTPERSKTGIRVSHRLQVRVHYKDLKEDSQRIREFKIATDALMSSCWSVQCR